MIKEQKDYLNEGMRKLSNDVSLKPQKIKKKGKFIQDVKKYKVLLLFLLPGLFIMLIKSYMPMYGIIMAFKNMNNTLGIMGSPWVGFKNFEFFFKSSDAWIITRNTVAYNAVFITLSVVLNAGLAICITEMSNKRMSKLYQTIFTLPHFFSIVVVAAIANAFLNTSNGFINNLLTDAGRNPIDWYTEDKFWPFILVFVYFWMQCGYGAIIYIATISGFDAQIFEAARIDGANRLQKIFYLTIPMLKQTMIVLTILALGNIFRGNFGLFYQVPMNSPLLYNTTDIIDTYVYRALSTMPDIGMTTAVGLFQSVVGCVLVVAVNLVVRRVDPDSALF